MSPRKRSKWLLLTIALLLCAPFTAFATHEAQIVHACVERKDGSVLRIVAFPELCDPSKEAIIEWNLEGPVGPEGPPGPPGPPGPTGTANAGKIILPGSQLNPPIDLPAGQDVILLSIPLADGAYVEAEVKLTFLLMASTNGLLDGSLRCTDLREQMSGELFVNATGGFQSVQIMISLSPPPLTLVGGEGVEISCNNQLTETGTEYPVNLQLAGAEFMFELGDVFLIEEVLPF